MYAPQYDYPSFTTSSSLLSRKNPTNNELRLKPGDPAQTPVVCRAQGKKGGAVLSCLARSRWGTLCTLATFSAIAWLGTHMRQEGRRKRRHAMKSGGGVG